MNNLGYYYAVKTIFIAIAVLLMISAVLLSCFIYHVIEQIMKFLRRRKNEADRQ